MVGIIREEKKRNIRTNIGLKNPEVVRDREGGLLELPETELVTGLTFGTELTILKLSHNLNCKSSGMPWQSLTVTTASQGCNPTYSS